MSFDQTKFANGQCQNCGKRNGGKCAHMCGNCKVNCPMNCHRASTPPKQVIRGPVVDKKRKRSEAKQPGEDFHREREKHRKLCEQVEKEKMIEDMLKIINDKYEPLEVTPAEVESSTDNTLHLRGSDFNFVFELDDDDIPRSVVRQRIKKKEIDCTLSPIEIDRLGKWLVVSTHGLANLFQIRYR